MTQRRKALIFGISGQDGAYLSRLLLDKGYAVFGTSRDCATTSFFKLHALDVKQSVQVMDVTPYDFHEVSRAIIHTQPDEIYNLSGQSSVGVSYAQPVETFRSIATATINILEAMRKYAPEAKFFNASSTDCFGNIGDNTATEETPFAPCSPYGSAKVSAYWTCDAYRSSYGLFVCSGILSNHESPLRPKCFVTQKIIQGAKDIAENKKDSIAMGNLDIERDWGSAEEYVAAMHKMLQLSSPTDFVIATGHTSSLRDFVEKAFLCFSLDYKQYVQSSDKYLRATDIKRTSVSPVKAKNELGWVAKKKVGDVISDMVEGILKTGECNG